MENYKIKINDHQYVVKGVTADIERLVSDVLNLTAELQPEKCLELLVNGLISKLDNLKGNQILAVNDDGLEYWDKHGIDPFEYVTGEKIISYMLADIRSEIEKQSGQPLKWFYEFDAMTSQTVKRYPNTGNLKDQLSDFEKSAKDGQVICLSDLLCNAGF